jgi:CRISPR/Cas system CSM-associated protein Csm5 (group 7 of RAMP superfamily)
MIRENLNTFYLKLTTITPLHIGTGEAYAPTNFVIDNGKLFEFDEVLFYQSLNPSDKREFGQKLNKWLSIIDFYRSKVTQAKAVARFECEVSKKIENTYKKLRNDDGSKKKNQFQIAESFKNPNTHRVVIPGSSIKGMLDTTFGIYARKVKSNEPRQRLILSDALLLDGKSEIGYAYRKHKNPTKTARSEIPQMVEVISYGSTFVLSIKTEYSFSKIQEMMKNYHEERRDSEYYQTANSFVARVGKFCGKEYMVDDGKNVLNTYDKPIATHTLYESGDAFGWVEIEQITKEKYDESLESIAIQEQDYYRALEEKQRETIEKIAHQKEELRALALAKVKREKEEAKAKAKKEAEQKAKLASMTPVQRLVESYSDVAVLINDMKLGKIEDFESIKVELAEEVKKILQQKPKTWDKAKKKALDRRVYIEGLFT